MKAWVEQILKLYVSSKPDGIVPIHFARHVPLPYDGVSYLQHKTVGSGSVAHPIWLHVFVPTCQC